MSEASTLAAAPTDNLRPKLEAQPSLRTLAIRGSIWTIAGYGASQVLRLGSNLILTRLLFPEAFGLMALVNVFMQGLAMFSDVGIGPSIVQNRAGSTREFLNTAWTVQVIRGTALWVTSFALAPLVASWYSEPQLAWMLPFAGSTAFIAGFNSTSLHLLRRRLMIRAMTVIDLVSAAWGVFLMVGCALIRPTVWALLLGGVGAAAVKMILSHTVLREPWNRFCWDDEARKSLLRMGRWIFLNTAIGFLGTNLDRLLLGKMVTMQMLGVYGLAAGLAHVGRGFLGHFSTNVVFPAASRCGALPRDELWRKVHGKRWLLLLVFSACLAVLAGIGDWLIYWLYDPRYHTAGWILPLLIIGLWPWVLISTADGCLLALGKPCYLTLGSVLRVIFVAVFMLVGFQWLGFLGVVIVVTLADWPRYVGGMIGLVRERLNFIRQDCLSTLVFCGFLVVIFGLRSLLGLGNPWDFIHSSLEIAPSNSESVMM